MLEKTIAFAYSSAGLDGSAIPSSSFRAWPGIALYLYFRKSGSSGSVLPRERHERHRDRLSEDMRRFREALQEYLQRSYAEMLTKNA